MAVKSGFFSYHLAGQTIYATPRPNLANWTQKVLCPQQSSPNTGLYSYSLDDSIAEVWGLFIGDTQPTGWNQEIGFIDLAASESNLIITPSIGYGAREVATDTIEIATDAARAISRTVYDAEGDPVTLPTCYFVICDENEKEIANLNPSIAGGTYTVTIPRSACQIAGEYSFALRASDPTNLDWDSGTIKVLYVANDTP